MSSSSSALNFRARSLRTILITTVLALIAALTASPATASIPRFVSPGMVHELSVAPVTVITQPTDATRLEGMDATFTAAAQDAGSADVPTTQWIVLLPGSGTWSPVPASAGMGTLTVTAVTAAMDSAEYRANFDDGNGGFVLSSVAVLHVVSPPSITLDPVDQTLARGEPFSLTASAIGNPTPTVRWQSRPGSSGGWTDVSPSATTSTLTAGAPEAPGTTMYYRALFDNDYGSTPTRSASITSTSYHLSPNPVASVDVASTNPGQLSVTWLEATGGPVTGGYLVTVYDEFDVVAASTTTAGLSWDFALPTGSFYAGVTAIGDSGFVGETYSGRVDVTALAQAGSLSATVLRPYVDGFQDSITLRASSNWLASGSIHILNSAGHSVRNYPLASGYAWSIAFTGRSVAGARLPFGIYSEQVVLNGHIVANHVFRILISQTAITSRSWSVATVFPAIDGYRDTTRLGVITSLPSTITIAITAHGKTYYSASLPRRSSTSLLWTARSAGRSLPAGIYLTTIVARGGEGVARTTKLNIVVSAKKKTAVSFSVTISAASAFDVMVTGSYWAGYASGSQKLWGSWGLGDYDQADYSATIPSSMTGYSGVHVSTCNSGTATAPLAKFAYTDPYGTIISSVVNLGNTYGACYRDTRAAPPGAFDGATLNWTVGNIDDIDLSYWEVNHFVVTGTRYVLK